MAKAIRLYPENFQEISDYTDYPLEELERIFEEAKRLGQTYVFIVGPREIHIRIELGQGGPNEAHKTISRSVSRGGLHLLPSEDESADQGA